MPKIPMETPILPPSRLPLMLLALVTPSTWRRGPITTILLMDIGKAALGYMIIELIRVLSCLVHKLVMIQLEVQIEAEKLFLHEVMTYHIQ